MITLCFALIFIIRLYTLSVSKRNEQALLAAGAAEHGANTSQLLATVHIAYYFSALLESYLRGASFDGTSLFGLLLTGSALAVLFYVIRALGEIWTVKIYIHPQHQLKQSWLFRRVRHPNYFLNIIPELIGIAFLCHAWTTLSFGLPLYGLVLARRIKQEEHAMRHLRVQETA
ncbi:isoprenylcysteine carboxyl methyltransferase family protein [Conchiformibius kuhniae]|uniref:Isoprenylcysteine carboxyl methyltransferase family protein n=1 Tax=Conchiformibius kuhniae TaxID=211502 RepID=A0A8T9MWI2_9NEIS|nr:isoprenylcysteine carboxyl methyltransferase family protein [Conchiformibius kuhniae]UOP05195.1 isoprenylcysteine carboxyl methyltransferase family protein [Conchiformibius kuhniae]